MLTLRYTKGKRQAFKDGIHVSLGDSIFYSFQEALHHFVTRVIALLNFLSEFPYS